MSRIAIAFLLFSSVAHGLTQPNGATIPSAPGCSSGKPDGLAAMFACTCTAPGVCNIGAPCPSQTSCDDGKHGTCESTLWHTFNDNTCLPSNHSGIDPQKDASLTPATFHPDCALTFTVVGRGTARFQNAFGWYNVTGAAPKASDLHVMLDCGAQTGKKVVLDVKNDPAYTGGDVGFFLVTPEDHAQKGACAGNDCCATVPRAGAGQGYVYYSERQFNPDAASAQPFIHLLVYDSTIVQHKVYFAWEDTYSGSNGSFTDLVTSVEGVQCGGAGLPCDTGQPGQCGRGVSSCEKGVLGCQAVAAAEPEVCNGLDDDCDGQIDEGATCGANQLCVQGHCVPHCTVSAEFACPDPLACDGTTGLCFEPTCHDVTCPDGQVCRSGHCVGPCDGIVCPHGSECVKGACVDACAQKSCEAGKVCVLGVCLPGCNQCGGVSCVAGTACAPATGACGDPSCGGPCPAGTFCDQGTCKDACAGAVCPTGQVCTAGACVPASNGSDGGVGGGGADQPGGNNAHFDESGCGCGPTARAGSPGTSKMASLFALLLLGLVRRRRR